ncbi:hypothetical protein FHL15_003231 [Xylaria flabelliformis]|uniref:Ketoreductase (KR) domain-containing protein n=1 Tax=Xylaria flabelliformis TaxID=2512241 RepID=A0A553I639_9PEZI|nr:hypothetical protein FHL15_003231 [Xylaria flabelliformis]
MSIIKSIQSVYTQYYPPRPTFTETDVVGGSQTGRVFFVTGANAGIGLELCKILCQTDATVYLASRTIEKAQEAIKVIRGTCPISTNTTDRLRPLQLDLADLSSVREAAKQFSHQECRLDVLWNNAGVGANAIEFGDCTAQGIEPLMGIHCVAPLLLTILLLPQLRFAAAHPIASAPLLQGPRVIWTTSGFAETHSPTNGVDLAALDVGLQDRVANYAASKAGVWILSQEFARRHSKDGIMSLPLNPGNVKSGVYKGTSSLLMFVFNTFMLYDAKLAAFTQLYGGLSPDITLEDNGIYIIPWGRIRRSQSMRSDILKAILPEENGGLGYGTKLWEWCDRQWHTAM